MEHTCSECVHEYKHQADFIDEIDAAGLVGIDDNCNVPEFTGTREDTDVNVNEIQEDDSMEIDHAESPTNIMISLIEFIQRNFHIHHMFTLIKHAWCSDMLLEAEDGIYGKILHVLLWIPIIISIIKPVTGFAEPFVILHH